jgi:hypothetical protein
LEENKPLLDVHLVVIDRGGNRGKVARVRVDTRDGWLTTAEVWEWPSGAPSPGQLSDMQQVLLRTIDREILTRFGLQGSLGG